MNVGRNMEEIKRVVVALQIAEKEQVLMPVNWNEGDDVLLLQGRFKPVVQKG